MIICRFCFVLTLTIIGCCFLDGVAAQEKAKPAPLVGTWKFDRESLTESVKCYLRLTEKDGKLAGTYSDAEEVKAKVGEVALKGDVVTIQLVFDHDGKQANVVLNGKLDGDTIQGTMVDGSETQDWKAQRIVALQDVVGKWRMSFTTPDGTERNPEFELSMDDKKPVVQFIEGEDSPEPAGGEISKVKFKDGFLTFSVALDFQGQPLKLEYEIEFMSSNRMEGSMYFEIEGTEMSGDVDVEGERISK